jgi:signal transduction histidine kinase/ligand-binding sensor domain-containing protein
MTAAKLHIIRFCLFILFIASLGNAFAQRELRFNALHYNRSSGIPALDITMMVQDKYGFIYLMANNDLIRFDGARFQSIAIKDQNGQLLEHTNKRLEMVGGNELILLQDKGYCIYNTSSNRIVFFPYPNGNAILASGNLVEVTAKELTFKYSDILYTISKDNGHLLTAKPIGQSKKGMVGDTVKPPSLIVLSANQNNKAAAQQYIDYQPAFFAAKPALSWSYFVRKDGKAIFFSDEEVLLYDPQRQQIVKSMAYPNGKKMATLRSPLAFSVVDSLHFVVALENELWLMDSQDLTFQSKINNQAGRDFIDQGYFRFLYKDNFGDLWAVSNIDGLYKINLQPQPIRRFQTSNTNGDLIKCISVNKKNNLVLAGTYGNGLLLYDTLGNLLKQFKQIGNDNNNIVTALHSLSNKECLVATYRNNRAYLLNMETKMLQSIALRLNDPNVKNKDKSFPYYGNFVPLADGRLFYGVIAGGFWEVQRTTEGLAVAFDSNSFKTIKPSLNIKFNLADSKLLHPFFEQCFKGLKASVASFNCAIELSGNWYIGTVRGLYIFNQDARLVKHIGQREGLDNTVINMLTKDVNGNLWLSTENGIYRVDPQYNVFRLGKEDGLQDDEFNVGALHSDTDGELFFGGIKGLNSFYPNQILVNDGERPNLQIMQISTQKRVLSEDTAFWNIKELALSNDNNVVSFLLTAIGKLDAKQYNYQYRIPELDSNWINLGRQQQFSLALNPGDYQVELAVSTFFNKDAKPDQQINIHVSRPIYLRWWFLLLTLVMLSSLSYAIVYTINKRRYQKKLQELRLQQQLENERRRISRDLHDNMGAYTTALMANVQTLKEKTGNTNELDKMQGNAEQILSSLRETIWVLNSKETSIYDLCENFKNYCFKLLRNYEDISFDADEQIEVVRLLTANQAIQINKILQEAFQNAIKHSQCTSISFKVTSNQEELTIRMADNGKGYNQAIQTSGNGLENMGWRAAQVGADIQFETAPGKGSAVIISL